jgi:mRNA-degrading endonuclease RelE of RelBE toxin-antitoxin system
LYTSEFTEEGLAGVKKLPKNVRNAMRDEFKNKIHVDPVGRSESLEGLLADYRSFHYRDYRVIYGVFEDIKAVSVVGVGKKDRGHHSEIYRQLEALAASGKLAQAVLDTYRSLSRSPGKKD